MNIAVCIKQVPDTSEIKVDPKHGTLIRAGVPSIMNPYDGYALEAAFRFRDSYPETGIHVFSMGPAQAASILKEAAALGCDHTYLISDRCFSGSDTLATGYILSRGIQTVQEKTGIIFDMIFCGKQAIDGDTAQTGPQLAENLSLALVTSVTEIHEWSGEELVVHRETATRDELVEVSLPCLLTFTKPQWSLRYPTLKGKLNAGKIPADILDSAILKADSSRIGLAGSPTKVKRTFVPEFKSPCRFLGGTDPVGAASELAALLSTSIDNNKKGGLLH